MALNCVPALALFALVQLTCASQLFAENFNNVSCGANITSKWRLEGAASVCDGRLRLTPVGGEFGRLVVDDFSPPGNSFYGRLYAHVEKFPSAPNYAHWVLVEALGEAGRGERVRPLNGQLIQEVGLNMWGVGSDGGATGDWTAWRESAPATEGVWTCLEWRVHHSDSSVRIWIDGVPNHELEVSRGSHGGKKYTNFDFPTFRSIWFGWWNFQPETTPATFNVTMDNIVLSTDRIYC